MADASEDALRQPSSSLSPGPNPPPGMSDSDSDDSPLDFRFLSLLTSGPNTSSTLPRRGTKDFEPDPTQLQSDTLAASREAMHSALSYTRVHAPKGHVRGIWDRRTGLTTVKKAKGAVFKTMGRGIHGGGVELLPEEALWAVERGALDVWWGNEGESEEDVTEGRAGLVRGSADEVTAVDDPSGESADIDDGQENTAGHEDKDDEDLENLIPMSLQAAYAAFLGSEAERGSGLTLEKYLVYAGLKRAGFVVLRAEGFSGRPVKATETTVSLSKDNSKQSLFEWLYQMLVPGRGTDEERTRVGPLVGPGLYRSYDDIYKLLHIIPSGHPRVTKTVTFTSPSNPPGREQNQHQHPFTTTYNIHKPSPHFRKSAPGPPTFRISVISARDTVLPTLTQLSDLLDEQAPFPFPSSTPISTIAPTIRPTDLRPNSNPTSIPSMYKRLKTEGRNVILAVVDEGVASYLRVNEAGFADQRIYERFGRGGARGGKGGGRGGRGGGGNGRGRGRGRGG